MNRTGESHRTREVLLPFAGFHEEAVDGKEISSQTAWLFADSKDNPGAYTDLEERFWDEVKVNWEGVKRQYSALYVDCLAGCLARSMRMQAMDSMRFLGLEPAGFADRHNDRLFATMAVSDLKRLRARVTPYDLDKHAQAQSDEDEEFNNAYGDKPDAWGALDTWDQNQLGCLVKAYIAEHEIMEEFNEDFAHWLMEEGRLVHDWIRENVSEDTLNTYDEICGEAYERVESEAKAEAEASM